MESKRNQFVKLGTKDNELDINREVQSDSKNY